MPAGRLGSGVLHVTVFDSSARPLAERLWYAGAGDSLSASAAASDTLFGPRSRVSLPLRVLSPDSTGAIASLAVRGRLKSIAGGGDTVSALRHAGLADAVTYLSTAGGAFLEWLEGKTLPGIKALEQAARKAA